MEAIKNHNKAIHIMNDWMRDPFITIGPDNQYYLTCTQQLNETNSQGAPVWKSDDLLNWAFIGFPYQLKYASNFLTYNNLLLKKIQTEWKNKNQLLRIWAPELHFINNKWILTHTSNVGLGNVAVFDGTDLSKPVSDWGANFNRHHDPTFFTDDDGSIYLCAKCAEIIKVKSDLSGFDGNPVIIEYSDRKLGHEGVCLIKFKNKYVLFGTAWSTDQMRRGTYNLYYRTSDNVTGPYNSRKFAGRFLGHGTVFKDKFGKWWCTAFYNANEPVLTGEESLIKDVSKSAYTINKQGLTIVPLEIKMINGDVIVTAKDKYYRNPGKEEVQQFEKK